MVVKAAGALVVVAACSGSTTKAVEDARKPVAPADAAVAPAVPLGPYRVDTAAKTGDVQIRVEWKDVPQPLRVSKPTECGTPAPPPLAPTTTWGIPDVFVSVEVDHGKALAIPRARVVLENCVLSPRAVVAGETLAIASAVEKPTSVALAGIGRMPLGQPAASGAPHTIYLPIVGHEVETALVPGTAYSVTAGSGEPSFVVSATTPYVAVTEASGNVILRDVPVGTYPVRAWLPARGGSDARTVTGSVTVTERALAEITLDIGAP